MNLKLKLKPPLSSNLSSNPNPQLSNLGSNPNPQKLTPQTFEQGHPEDPDPLYGALAFSKSEMEPSTLTLKLNHTPETPGPP